MIDREPPASFDALIKDMQKNTPEEGAASLIVVLAVRRESGDFLLHGCRCLECISNAMAVLEANMTAIAKEGMGGVEHALPPSAFDA